MSGKITEIKLQKKNLNRVNIYIDGEYAFGLTRFTAAWLQEGQDLSDEKISELLEQDTFEVNYQRTLKYIETRERSTDEIARYLNKYDVPGEVSAQIISRLQESGLLSDERFARMWVENRNEYRPRSHRALRMELRQHGIDDETIDQSLDGIDEESIAYLAAKKYAHKLRNKDWEEFRKKLYGYLGRRGFNYELSAAVIKQVWDEIDHPNHDK